jgi:Glycogen debranching enzyme N terminal/Amylo-alpha-1,6-glucosidase
MRTRGRFVFGTQVCTSLAEGAGADREWLCTDGTGGYAMGTVAGLRTRRQHGLLVTADRKVALLTLDPVMTLTSGARVELGVHQWMSGAVAPHGHLLLESFDLTDGVPRWRWRTGGVVVERELAMERGRTGVAVVHRVIAAAEPVELTLAALCTWRDADAGRTAAGPPPAVEPVAGGVVVEGAYRIAGPGWRPGGTWWYGARTRDGREDLWHAGTFTTRLAAGDTREVCAWAGEPARRPPSATAVVSAARARARRLVAVAKPADEIDAHLALAADAHIVAGPGVVAGYPAATGDVLAGYEGLFVQTGRAAEGRAFLRGYPHRTLWYPHAVARHVIRTGDADLAAELLPALVAQLDGYQPDPADGLLGDESGKPVGRNALWINALGAVARLCELTGADAASWPARYDVTRAGFAKRYPAPDGWLYDVVDAPPPPYPLGGSSPFDDPVLRPQQVLAWSLPYAALDGTSAEPLDALGRYLLTPLGLRSLAAHEYGYRGGDRDHGSAWPWLAGAYASACVAAGRPAAGVLAGLTAHLGEYGLGSVSELADGDPPHRAGGAPFHALGVAELLRARRLVAATG